MVIGLVIFVLVAVAAIYFAMQVTINKAINENGHTEIIIEMPVESDYITL